MARPHSLALVLFGLGLGVALGAPACGDSGPIEPVGKIVRIDRAGYSVRFDSNALTFDLLRGDDILATFATDGFLLGTVDTVDDSVNYDPWGLVGEQEGYLPPAGLAFHGVENATIDDSSTTRLLLTLKHEGDFESTLEIVAEADGRFHLHFAPKDAKQVAYLRIGARVTADPENEEAFYGLGEVFDDVNQRGKRRAMQLEIDKLESGYNEAHVPVPLLIGTRGWGMFVASSYPGAFDVASADNARVEITYGTGGASAEGLDLHLFAAERPLDVTKLYYDLTGYPRLPAPWAVGPLVWRDENDDQAQVESDLDVMRTLDLATSGIWIDRPYATGVETFDFESARFPDPQGMIQKAHDLGYRVALWHVPYLDEADASTAALRAEAEQNGYYPKTSGLKLNKWGKLIDFTADGATAWWQSHVSAYTDMGIEGFKLDYGEDVVPGAFGARDVFEFRDGSDERTMHRGYTLLYHQAYRDLLPDDGGFLLCRAGKWGDQVNGPIIWPGDLDARLWKFGEEQSDGTQPIVAVGGLHASMVAGLSLGPSGFPFYGSDTGGYRHAPPDTETFRRWFEQTALSSVMQIGTGANDVAWEFGDDALLASYRDYTRLHLRLFPYEWTLANDIAKTGYPIQRPLGLVEPELRSHPSDEYFFGDALLVAPVTEAGATKREVRIPSGTWVDWWTGDVTEGPTTVNKSAPLGTIPLWIRAGAPLPMLRPEIDTLAPVEDPTAVESFASETGPLYVRVARGPQSTLVVYDGTSISQEDLGDTVDLDVDPGSVFDQGTTFEVIQWGGAEPDGVTMDGTALTKAASLAVLGAVASGYAFESGKTGGTLWVKLPAGKHAVVVNR
ncbi:MAG TPA: TIM-barrel domain-containing protein [Polyangiaceae bacterium]|nr:TIM-barrel domain-containing protein [Polyangiaceae bacterium]